MHQMSDATPAQRDGTGCAGTDPPRRNEGVVLCSCQRGYRTSLVAKLIVRIRGPINTYGSEEYFFSGLRLRE